MVGARHGVALGVWLATLGLVVGSARGEPSSLLVLASVGAVSESRPVPVAPYRPDPLADEVTLPELGGPDLPLVTTSVVDREPTDLRLLVTEGERWRLIDLGAAVRWPLLSAKVTAFGQLPYADSVPADAPALDEARRPAALGVTGQVGDFEVGAQYRSVGRRLERLVSAPAALKDREGHEVWAAQRLGALRLRLAESRLTDNVDRNPALARTTTDQTAITAELAMAAWPVLGLTLATGESQRSRLTPEGREAAVEQREFDSVAGAAHYRAGPGWDVTVSSTVARARHVVGPDDDVTVTSQGLTLTLHPIPFLTASSTVSLAQERSAGSGLAIDSGTAGVSVAYAPAASRWSVSSVVSYTTTRARDGSTDGRSVSLGGALRCGLGRWLPGASVSLEAGYDRSVDAAVPDSASRAVTGLLLLKLAAF
jgi:hypothetical protein